MKTSGALLAMRSPKSRSTTCKAVRINLVRSPLSQQFSNKIKQETMRPEFKFTVSSTLINKRVKNSLSKIYSSDFWTPTMKFQYKKLSEEKELKIGGEFSLCKSPVLYSNCFDDKLMRCRTEDSLKQRKMLHTNNKIEDCPKVSEKSETYSKKNSLEKIIEDCNKESSRNKSLGKDIFWKRKAVMQEFESIRESINNN